MSQESASTLLISFDGASPSQKDLKETLEKGDVAAKIQAMKKLVMLQLNGEPQNAMIMTVIKHIVPQTDHKLKKLMLYFWEVVDKTDAATGQLLPEMILLCSFLRSDLQHPNEYIRGVTLRFLCKLKERDILESLVPSVVQNISHRVTYVRRNAVLAIHAIFTKFPNLLPDAPELIEKFLDEENDVSAKRNAFNMLFQCSQERAVRYLTAFRENEDMAQAGDVFQLAVVDLIKQLIQQNPFEKAKYVPIIFAVLQSKSPSVLYQCATTLVTLSSSPTAIKHAVNTFIHLLTTHSDNNVRLIVIERLVEMKERFGDLLQESLMDILRALTTGTVELRRHIMNLALDLVNKKNIEGFVQFMKKELVRSQSEEVGDAEAQQEYRQVVVKAMHAAVMRYLHVAPTVVPIMLDFVCEPGASAYDVALFVREVMQQQPELRDELLTKLAALFPMISSQKVLRTVLWMFGVHSRTVEQITNILENIKHSLEPVPLTVGGPAVADVSNDGPTTVATTTVREDGTYVMSIQMVSKKAEAERSDLTGLRAQIVSGDFFLAAALANTIAKLVVTLFKKSVATSVKNSLQSDAMEIMHELIRFGTSGHGMLIDDDSHERIRLALTVAQNPHNEFLIAIAEESFEAFASIHDKVTGVVGDGSSAGAGGKGAGAEEAQVILNSLDQPLTFTQLSQAQHAALEFEANDDVAIAVANTSVEKGDSSNFLGRLQRILQLSGCADPVYCEAMVTVHEFDILLELNLINQTSNTLNNVTVELSTVGDLKLCERPQVFSLEPRGQMKLKTSIKVSSTETGAIFGSIMFDGPADRNNVILNEIHIDIMDYIKPATCTQAEFRSMWIAFDWENKVIVNTDISDMRVFMDNVIAQTNMRPIDSFPLDDCPYLSCSLYAKSVFGEDAVANVSIEQTDEGRIEGVIRIRSKTQGIALGLGEKVSARQKSDSAKKG